MLSTPLLESVVFARIFVDAVINHMVGSDRGSGTGTAGSHYSAPDEDFPGVPWTKADFNGPWDCDTYNQGIMNWDDPVQVGKEKNRKFQN